MAPDGHPQVWTLPVAGPVPSARVRRMRIGMLHPYCLGTSGSGVYLIRLMRALLSRGHQLTVLSHDEHPEHFLPDRADQWQAWPLRAAGTPVAYPRAEEPGGRLFQSLGDAELQAYLDYHAREVASAAMSHGLDVLHVNGEVPMSAVAATVCSAVGLPYVTVAHGSSLEYLCRTDSRFQRLAETGLAGASMVIAPNLEVAARVSAISPAARVRTVPVGVDTGVFVPRARPPGPRTLAYVGRLSLDKGIFHLIGCLPELARLVPDVRLVVVGDGIEPATMERFVQAVRTGGWQEASEIVRSHTGPAEQRWAQELIASWRVGNLGGSRRFEVQMLHRLDEHGVARALSGADAVVVPSLVPEAFPLVMVEALACGVPPAATDVGGLAAVLDEFVPQLGTLGALLRLPGTSEELAHQLPYRLVELLEWTRPDHRRGMAQKMCRQLAVQRYSWERVADGLELAYRAAVGRRLPALTR